VPQLCIPYREQFTGTGAPSVVKEAMHSKLSRQQTITEGRESKEVNYITFAQDLLLRPSCATDRPEILCACVFRGGRGGTVSD
jgi:hypothetical protein